MLNVLMQDLTLDGCDKVKGCFPAGTRVWTEQGLVPIEQIKVGDLVLSQPEQQGEQAYKQVVNTFAFEERSLRAISFKSPDGVIRTLFATENHPFWVIEEELYDDEDDEDAVAYHVLGWTAAEHLEKLKHLFVLADGTKARVIQNFPVYRTENPNFGWVQHGEWTKDGYVFDFLNYDLIGNEIIPDPGVFKSGSPHLKVRVYNIEVVDFHTYFVTKAGVWVHNTNCGKDDSGGQF